MRYRYRLVHAFHSHFYQYWAKLQKSFPLHKLPNIRPPQAIEDTEFCLSHATAHIWLTK